MCNAIAEALGGGVDGGPETVVIAGRKLVRGEIAGQAENGRGHQAVTVVAGANSRFEIPGFLLKGHGPQLDMRDAFLGA